MSSNRKLIETLANGSQTFIDINGKSESSAINDLFQAYEDNMSNGKGGIFLNCNKKEILIASRHLIEKVYPKIFCELKDCEDGYYVDYIYADIDQWIEDNNFKLVGLKNYVSSDDFPKKTNFDDFDEIQKNNMATIVCYMVDKLLNGMSIVLNGRFDFDVRTIIFYTLRCLPFSIANKIVVNTCSKENFYRNEESQFIGYTDDTVGNLVDGKKIFINSFPFQLLFNNFYSRYLLYLFTMERKTYVDLYEIYYLSKENKDESSNVLNIESAKKLYELKMYEDLKSIIEKLSADQIIQMIENENMSFELKNFFTTSIQEKNSMMYIKICNSTDYLKYKENSTINITEVPSYIEIDELALFYKKQGGTENVKKFVSEAFKLCLEKIEKYDESLFESVYNLKVLIQYDSNKMGYWFTKKAHDRFADKFAYELSDMHTQVNDDKTRVKKAETFNISKRILTMIKHCLEVLLFSHFSLLFIPLLLGFTLLFVPDQIWKYISLLLGFNSWNVMIWILNILIILASLFYILPYTIMRKNTVHLNGFSIKTSIFISLLCVLIFITMPILSIIFFIICRHI